MITIFTPTYNRAYKLKSLFDSLVRQTIYDFEWVIVDDGSTDSTHELVKSFNTNNMFSIRYFYKENEGKQIAINFGVKEAKGEWFFIVDSDDTLTENALEIIQQYCDSIKNKKKFGGVVGLRGNEEKKVWETWNPDSVQNNRQCNLYSEQYVDATALEYRFKLKIKGDRAEVVRTELLTKYPFPKIKGETFIPESYLWYSLARDGYRFRWFNEVIYITEYLQDGLTRNGRVLAKQNCLLRSCLENLMISLKEVPVKIKIKSVINYYRYGMIGRKSVLNLFQECKNKTLGTIFLPIGVLFYFIM